jgi:hypothetical protein
VRSTILSLLTVLVGVPCAASSLTVANLQAQLRSEAAGCPAEAPRLKIERVTVGGSKQHNQVRREIGQKVDGRPGQRYAIVYVRGGKQIVSVASLGPLDATVRPDDLRSLRGIDYCSVDEN